MKRLLLIIPLALGLVTQSTYAALFDAFLKIEGVDGESADSRHTNEIEIASFSWGMTNPSTGATAGGGGGGQGKAVFQDMHFVTKFSKASPKLMLACATGQHIRSLSFAVHQPGGEKAYYIVKMEDVLVSSYQSGGAGADAMPVDQFSVNYAKIQFTHVAFDGKETSGEASRVITPQ